MSKKYNNYDRNIPEQVFILPQIVKWSLIALFIGLLAGSASAIFLYSLDKVTVFRETHLWIIALLPIAGFFIGWVYHHAGKSAEKGNNLILDEIHDPQNTVPLRMTPLILLGTLMTHLFGGSAGREGTAVQMGASLADQLTKPLRLKKEDRRILLMAGISAGFASVFGTPLAGAVFGLEVLAIGRLRYDAIFPCFLAAIIAHQVTLLWGIHHTLYSIPFVPAISILGILSAIIAGSIFGITGMLFAKTTQGIQQLFKKYISYAPLRPFVGGFIIALSVWIFHSTQFIGLGIPVMVDSFSKTLPAWDSLAKLAYTALTLGSGFKGGEVTPLFFIGATLGNALSGILSLPLPLMAGMGFVGVFAGASNTPIASTLIAVELFGPEAGVFAGIACVVSYLFSGHAGIYHSQYVGVSKHPVFSSEEGLVLSSLRALRKTKVSSIHLVQDIHFLGFLNRKEKSMKEFVAARFYFHYNAKVKTKGFWSKLTNASLGIHLANLAKDFGIEQAVLHRVSAGFLKGDRLMQDISETPPPKLPQCLEMIDHEEKIKSFIQTHQEVLKETRTILLKCDAPLFDSAIEEISAIENPVLESLLEPELEAG